MTLTEETLRFIREHRKDNVRNLALQAHKYPTVDVPAAIIQIVGRQIAEEKIPAWAAREGILYPAHLSMEQCSSEVTANYKVKIVSDTEYGSRKTFTDLTGGFGIDCAFLSACFQQSAYVERQETLCTIAAHNFLLLNLKQVMVCHEDSIRYLQMMEPVDWIFIDPARRDGHGGKTIAISECEPDVSALENLLLEKASHVLVKLSPMLDLTLALHDLKHVQAAHVVSVNNECKELLILLGQTSPAEISIHCVNLFTKGTQKEQHFVFTREQEQCSECTYTDSLETYLYEPNASLLKAGAFRSIAAAYPVRKLHPNSHLYTSDTFIENFPGRIFRIVNQCSFNKKEVKENLADLKKANVTVRNFPATVAELRKRIHLAEGGDTYLFASTLNNGQKVLIRCEKV
mgnify:CR=1 FL=1